MTRAALLLVAGLLAACGPRPAAPAPCAASSQPAGDRVDRVAAAAWPLAAPAPDGLRALGTFRPGPEWRHFEVRGMKVAVATEVLPSDGESYIDLYGYVHNRRFREWRRFLAVQLRGAGHLEVRLDEATGTLVAVGAANNDLRGQPLFTFDLRAVHDDR